MDPQLRIIAAASAVVVWPHRRGGWTRSLLQLRIVRAEQAPPGESIAAVISMLRDNPRGRGIGSDFAGCANAALQQFVPPATNPAAVTWYAHHGSFSSYDPTGPDTLEQVRLRWDGQRYLDPEDADFHLLDDAQFAARTQQLKLEPVEELLARWAWDTTVPPRLPASR